MNKNVMVKGLTALINSQVVSCHSELVDINISGVKERIVYQ